MSNSHLSNGCTNDDGFGKLHKSAVGNISKWRTMTIKPLTDGDMAHFKVDSDRNPVVVP